MIYNQVKARLLQRIGKSVLGITKSTPTLSLALILTMMCAKSALAVTSEELLARLKDSKLIEANLKLNASIDEARKTAIVTTFLSGSADQQKDLKITAVIIAKEAMEIDKNAFAKVKVDYFAKTDVRHYYEVVVTAGDIAAFSTGAITREKLLDSLEVEGPKDMSPAADNKAVASGITSSTTANKSGTVSNPQAQGNSTQINPAITLRLKKLSSMINELKKARVGVKPYEQRYNEIAESAARNENPESLNESIDSLLEAVAEQSTHLSSTQPTSASMQTQDKARLAQEKGQYLDEHQHSVASLSAMMTNPETSAADFADLGRKTMGQLVSQYNETFGQWKPSEGPPLFSERMHLSRHYLVLQSKKVKMDSYWYTFKEIERLVSYYRQLSEQGRQLLAAHQVTGEVAAKLNAVGVELKAKMAEAYRESGCPPAPDFEQWHHHHHH